MVADAMTFCEHRNRPKINAEKIILKKKNVLSVSVLFFVVFFSFLLFCCVRHKINWAHLSCFHFDLWILIMEKRRKEKTEKITFEHKRNANAGCCCFSFCRLHKRPTHRKFNPKNEFSSAVFFFYSWSDKTIVLYWTIK